MILDYLINVACHCGFRIPTFSLARPACFCTDLASRELLLSAMFVGSVAADSLRQLKGESRSKGGGGGRATEHRKEQYIYIYIYSVHRSGQMCGRTEL